MMTTCVWSSFAEHWALADRFRLRTAHKLRNGRCRSDRLPIGNRDSGCISILHACRAASRSGTRAGVYQPFSQRLYSGCGCQTLEIIAKIHKTINAIVTKIQNNSREPYIQVLRRQRLVTQSRTATSRRTGADTSLLRTAAMMRARVAS